MEVLANGCIRVELDPGYRIGRWPEELQWGPIVTFAGVVHNQQRHQEVMVHFV